MLQVSFSEERARVLAAREGGREMSGFPIAWDDAVPDLSLPTRTCPYSREEIQEYLRSCHYHWVLDEEPMLFRAEGPVLARQVIGRNYWIWSAKDDLKREWLIIVGSGESPFDPGKQMWRWMYGQTNDLGQSPTEFFDNEYAEQLTHDARARS